MAELSEALRPRTTGGRAGARGGFGVVSRGVGRAAERAAAFLAFFTRGAPCAAANDGSMVHSNTSSNAQRRAVVIFGKYVGGFTAFGKDGVERLFPSLHHTGPMLQRCVRHERPA